MKRKILALATVLVLMLSLLAPAGLVPTAQAVSADDARAYLDILDETNPVGSHLIDFDGDGRDELMVFRTDPDRPTGRLIDLYQGEKALTVSGIPVPASGRTYSIVTKEGKSYLKIADSYGDGEAGMRSYVTVEDGQWGAGESFHYRYSFASGAMSIVCTSGKEDMSQAEGLRRESAYQVQFDVSQSKNDVRPQLEAIVKEAAYADMTPSQLLAEMAYAGDRSKCRMTADQAAAYADALAQTLQEEQARDLGHGIISQAVLFDTGAGVPAMMVSSIPARAAGSFETRAYVWEYLNGQITSPNYVDKWNTIYEDHLVIAGMMGSASVFEFQNGHINWTATTTQAMGALIDDQEVSEEEIAAWDAKWRGNDYLCSMDVYGGNVKNVQDTNTLIALLRAYAAADLAPQYPSFPDILGTGWETEPVKVASAAVSGEAVACHSLTDGMCYVLFQTANGYQGVLLQARRQRGQVVWQVVRTDAQPASQEALAAEVDRFLGSPNVAPDFDRLLQGQSADELAAYLRSLLSDMTGKGPNDLAKGNLAAFVDSAVSSLTTQTVTGQKNLLRLDGDLLGGLGQEGRKALETLTGALEENGVTLNRALTPRVRVVWSNVDLDKPCQVDLTADIARLLEGEELRVILGAGDTYLQLSADDISALTGTLGGLSIQLSREEDGAYALRFLDGNGNVVDRLDRPVTVSLPAAGALSTIMVSYAGGSDNWGGQYDPAAGAISFSTPYSGRYEILENNVALDDIAGLSDESRAAISFMVSRGYFSASDGLFRPGDQLTRYEFSKALVGMFFALDRSLTADFPDVPGDSPYYSYVASAQAQGLVNGYSDGTFSGQDPITREQVFALAARTLMNQKGYTQPQDFEPYLLSFQDREEISQWAAPLVALSVREGVSSRGAVFLPQANVTREQAAVLLYRLFQLLYEVSPVALDVPGAQSPGGLSTPAIVGISVGAAAAAAGGAAFFLLRKKPKAAGGGKAS